MRRTDKERLDFLSKQDAAYLTIAAMGNYWNVRRRMVAMGQEETGKTLRSAIDAAMASADRARGKRGGRGNG